MLAETPTDDGLAAALARWPAAVQGELRRRRALVDAAISARPGPSPAIGPRILDLAEPDARALVRAAASTAGLSAGATAADVPPGGYDAVISIAALVAFADLAAALRGIDHLLAPTGELHLVEPVLRPGWRGMVESSPANAVPGLREVHLGRDVPQVVRATGLLISDITRFTMPTSLWPLRPFVHARAIRFPEATAAGAPEVAS